MGTGKRFNDSWLGTSVVRRGEDATLSGGDGEIQISPDGKYMMLYNKLTRVGGFDYHDVDLVTVQLSADHQSIKPATLAHVTTINGGNHGTGGVEFASIASTGAAGQATMAMHATQQSVTQTSGSSRRLWSWLWGGTSATTTSFEGYLMAGGLPGQVVKIGNDANQASGTYTRALGNKLYEITDHLGNTRVTFADLKTTNTLHSTDCATADEQATRNDLAVDATSATDYYPFGMTMPGRLYNPDAYRFGFNGQEKDNEIGSGIYTAEYWEYDSRIGRRWNVDPVTYAWQSSYACFNNNPIALIDPLGLAAGDPPIKAGDTFTGDDGKVIEF